MTKLLDRYSCKIRKNSVADLLYILKKHKVLLWLNSEGKIVFKAFAGIPKSTKELIANNKSVLVSVLKYNNLDSEDKAKGIFYYRIPKKMREQVLSDVQKGMLIQSKIEKNKSVYNVPIFVYISEANIDLLKKSLYAVLSKHQILRMCGISDNFNYKILKLEDFDLPILKVDRENLEEVYDEKSRYEFDLSFGKLINVEIICINNSNDVVLNLTHHHILSDGYSVGLIISDILSFYDNFLSDNQVDYKNDGIDYFDYVQYQTFALKSKEYTQTLKQLAKKIDSAELLQLRKKIFSNFDSHPKKFQLKLKRDVYHELKTVSMSNGVTLYALLLTGLYHVLSTYSAEQSNFSIGINISNRTLDLNYVVGPCISTIALVPEYNSKKSFIENVFKFNSEISHLREYPHINLNGIARYLSVKTNLELEDAVRVVFTMYNSNQSFFNISRNFQNDIRYKIIERPELFEKFGISVDAVEENEDLYFDISYVEDLYDANYIQSIFRCFVVFLENLTHESIFFQISRISLISDWEYDKAVRSQLLHSNKKYKENTTMHELFEKQVQKTPDSVALIYQNLRLTYDELNKRANVLARYLIDECGVKRETLVPLFVNRGEHMLIAMIAILKSGGAFVPIDVNYPAERIKYILDDIRAKFVLTVRSCKQKLHDIDESLNVVILDDINLRFKQRKLLCSNINLKMDSENLAYIIYTSGTTGRPKGVMVEHKGVVNLAHCLRDCYKLEKNEVILQLANYVFDASIEQIVLALLNGKALLIIQDDLWSDKDAFYGCLLKNGVTHVEGTPTLLDQYDFNQISRLNRIISGGEYLSVECYSKLANDNVKNVINTYGPTETTINSVINVVEENNICIGKPIENTNCYVLNKSLIPLPIGAIGELYIGGIGLARGYLNRADLTSEKFVASPFEKGERLYKTGDLVSWAEDYSLEYFGRNDSQVKIRGYRIELKEIESVLSTYPGIKQAAVVMKNRCGNSEDKYIVGYYVSDKEVREDEVLRYLKGKLADYMIPSILVHLTEFPATVNGKLDVNALPTPKFNKAADYVPPRDKLEKIICNELEQIFGFSRNTVSIYADFFQLGGNSILAVKLIQLLNDLFFEKNLLTVKDLYLNPSAKELANFVRNGVCSRTDDAALLLQKEAQLDESIMKISGRSSFKDLLNVFITGATGFLGTYLLKELCQSDQVKRVFCLVVSATKEEASNKIRQALEFFKLGGLEHKIVPVVGTLSEKYFGLSKTEFENIADNIDIIIHSATFMDHLATYRMLKTVNVKGTEEILRFACTKRPKVVNLISTTEVFSKKIYQHENSDISNEVHLHSDGYNSSKWVSEALCNIARNRGIDCNIYRLSLLLPSTVTPVFPMRQWLGRLVKSCLIMGMFPSQFCRIETQVSYVNLVAKAITHASLNLTSVTNQNFHLFTNKPLSFNALFKQMNMQFNCQESDLSDWLNKYYQLRLADKVPLVSIIEDEKVLNEIIGCPNDYLSNAITRDFFLKYGIDFELNNDNGYINSLVQSAKMSLYE